jgi:hypothetical protein
MKIMIGLPDGKYFAVPREALDKHAVSKADFEKELASTVADVEGQEGKVIFHVRSNSVGMGTRG